MSGSRERERGDKGRHTYNSDSLTDTPHEEVGTLHLLHRHTSSYASATPLLATHHLHYRTASDMNRQRHRRHRHQNSHHRHCHRCCHCRPSNHRACAVWQVAVCHSCHRSPVLRGQCCLYLSGHRNHERCDAYASHGCQAERKVSESMSESTDRSPHAHCLTCPVLRVVHRRHSSHQYH